MTRLSPTWRFHFTFRTLSIILCITSPVPRSCVHPFSQTSYHKSVPKETRVAWLTVVATPSGRARCRASEKERERERESMLTAVVWVRRRVARRRSLSATARATSTGPAWLIQRSFRAVNHCSRAAMRHSVSSELCFSIKGNFYACHLGLSTLSSLPRLLRKI